MNFSVHFDEATLDRLAAAVGRTGLTRNRIIVLAVQQWLDRNEEPDWPRTLKEHFQNPAPELAANDDADLVLQRPDAAAAGVRW
ncbi:MAG TPA: CopG family transcriptional regulator [Nevskiaceae bacterium]|nr:CopG family transcriptional regulator [Nevskiaceae bacterium]